MMTASRRSRTGRAVGVAATALVVVLALTSCAGAPGPNNVAEVATGHTAGFWAGLWHGLILPITFVVSLFTDQVNVYDVHNNGGWYNFGYVLGIFIPVTVFRPHTRTRRARSNRRAKKTSGPVA